MIRHTITHTVVSEKDAKKYMTASGYKTTPIDLPDKSWAFDNVTGVIRVKSLIGGFSAYSNFPSVFLESGDTIDFEGTFRVAEKSMSGMTFSVEYSENENFSPYTAPLSYVFKGVERFKEFAQSHTAFKKGYYRVVVGYVSTSKGELFMKKLMLKYNSSHSSLGNSRESKVYALEKVYNTNTWAFAAGYAGSGGEITVGVNDITITFDKPLKTRPFVTTQLAYNSNVRTYELAPKTSLNNSIVLTLVNRADYTVVDISSLPITNNILFFINIVGSEI